MRNKRNWLGSAVSLLIVLGVALPVWAADDDAAEGWKKDFEMGLNILQSSYSSNWNGGEKGSIVWTARFDGQMEKHMSELTNWHNTLKLVYGQTHSQDRIDDELVWRSPDKSDDLIDFESLFRFTPKSWVDPFVALNFNSLFRTAATSTISSIELRTCSQEVPTRIFSLRHIMSRTAL